MSNTSGLRSIEQFQNSNAAFLVAMCAEVEAAPPAEHHERLLYLAQCINTDEVLQSLRQGALAERGAPTDWHPTWARIAGGEMAEAVLRAVGAVLLGVERYDDDAREFAVLDAFSSRCEEFEAAQGAMRLAPAAAWDHLRVAGLSPEMGGDWWCDAYRDMVEGAN